MGNIFELIQFGLELITSPVEAIATIVIFVAMFAGVKRYASRLTSTLPPGTAPEVLLRHRLKCTDDDLKQNRSGILSPKQIKRIRNEFLIMLTVHLSIIGFMGYVFSVIFWADWTRGDLVEKLFGAFMGLLYLFSIGLGVHFHRTYIIDLRAKKVITLFSPIVFEKVDVEYLGFKLQSHSYKIIINDKRLPASIPLGVGIIPDAEWKQIEKLINKTAFFYVSPSALRLLSVDLLETLSGTNQLENK